MTPEDIKRINYIYYSSFRTFVKSPHSLAMCYILFFLRTIAYIFLLKFRCTPASEVLFVVPSLNNKKSVKTITDRLPENKISIWGSFKDDIPMAAICFYSLFHLKAFRELYRMSSAEDRRLMRQFYVNFMSTSGYHAIFNKIIKKSPNLKLIVVANDHVTGCRCLIELAEQEGIRTLYVQHASVSERFPPLRFDYSFLDGMESYEKYKSIGNMRGEVFLAGSPRFDAFLEYKDREKSYDIGIALNMLDSIEKVIELCQYLKVYYSSKIIVRPHPGMYEKMFDEKLFLSMGIDVSNPLKDLSHVFLSSIKVMIANESSIHLDAAIMGVPSVLYNFGCQDIVDWYSYIKHGLITVCTSNEDLVEKLNEGYDLPVSVVRYYVASFNSQTDGRVGEMIANFVKKVCESPYAARDYIEHLMVNHGEFYEYRNKMFI